jgi:hypothetical protein
MQVQSGILFETPVQIYSRVFRELRPRTPLPQIRVEYCRFANANSFIWIQDGVMRVRISDALEGAPAPVQEALAFILVGKLFRKPVAPAFAARYRRWLNRADVRRHVMTLRSLRGRKYLSGAKGAHYDLEEIFEDLNLRFFHGLMARPRLSWSRQRSRTMLGHWDPAHNAIVISKLLDSAAVPRVAVEYVVFHEMLHLRFPVEHHGSRRCVHSAEFRAAEREFPEWRQARRVLGGLGAAKG